MIKFIRREDNTSILLLDDTCVRLWGPYLIDTLVYYDTADVKELDLCVKPVNSVSIFGDKLKTNENFYELIITDNSTNKEWKTLCFRQPYTQADMIVVTDYVWESWFITHGVVKPSHYVDMYKEFPYGKQFFNRFYCEDPALPTKGDDTAFRSLKSNIHNAMNLKDIKDAYYLHAVLFESEEPILNKIKNKTVYLGGNEIKEYSDINKIIYDQENS